MCYKFVKILAFFLLFIFSFHATVNANLTSDVDPSYRYDFTTPRGIETQVEFWKKIYSEYSTSHAVIHDTDDLSIIYEVVYFADGLKNISRHARDRKLNRIKRKYKKLLLKISRTKNPKLLNSDARRLYNLVGSNFKKASRRIRVQIGQKDRFKKGLEMSGLYIDQIEHILRKAKLPLELAVLPHVESSFQVNAYSSSGAAGIWQFTRGTGRLFMNIGYDVDERRDPILSTVAAAKLLKRNFEVLKSWPLAITAYNHGTQGINRARKKHGRNIVKIINKYKSRTFGFASKNFYAEFLAALHVVKNKEKYFPGLKFYKPQKMKSVLFNDFIHIDSIISHFKMTRNEIIKYNPSLRKPVIRGQKRIPKGFMFQVPENQIPKIGAFYNSIPRSERYKNQIRSNWHTVSRGDTLSGVAMRFNTSVKKLYTYNNLTHKNKIYIGQVLRLPNTKNSGKQQFRYANNNKNYLMNTAKYRVRRSDNLTKIAKRFNTNVNVLLSLNSINNPNKLKLGQRLTVPNKKLISKNKDLKNSNSNNNSKFNDVVIENIIKNRPAFLPVSFSGKVKGSPRVGYIKVDFDETLSHYAEWSKLSINKILSINGMRSQSRLTVHSKIKVPFIKTDPDSFEERRQEYHKSIQEDFFNNYRVDKLLIRNVLKGETVWEICSDIYSIPFWLLAGYNPDKDINVLSVGEHIIVPIVSPIKSS